jgi:hypothetical protein
LKLDLSGFGRSAEESSGEGSLHEEKEACEQIWRSYTSKGKFDEAADGVSSLALSAVHSEQRYQTVSGNLEPTQEISYSTGVSCCTSTWSMSLKCNAALGFASCCIVLSRTKIS